MPPPKRWHGVSMAIKPARHGLAVVATVLNSSPASAFLVRGVRWGNWRLSVFDVGGRPVPSDVRHPAYGVPPGYNKLPGRRIKPGASVSKRLGLGQYPMVKTPGTFYLYAK